MISKYITLDNLLGIMYNPIIMRKEKCLQYGLGSCWVIRAREVNDILNK